MSKPWFRVKRYGLGYSPSSWEGWAATFGFVALLLADAALTRTLFADARTGRMATVAVFVALLAAFLLLCMRRCDKPIGWRWGGDR